MVNKKGLIVEGFPTIAMDGFHAAQIIHNTYGVPVVFRTAHGDEGRPDWAVSPAPRLWLALCQG